MHAGKPAPVVPLRPGDDSEKRRLKAAIRRQDAKDRAAFAGPDPFGGAALFTAMIDLDDGGGD